MTNNHIRQQETDNRLQRLIHWSTMPTNGVTPGLPIRQGHVSKAGFRLYLTKSNTRISQMGRPDGPDPENGLQEPTITSQYRKKMP